MKKFELWKKKSKLSVLLDGALIPLIAFGAIFINYFIRLPRTIQSGGDSAEIAYATFSLIVPHPPGYPLWVWLGHLWGKLGIGVSYYHSLAILNLIFSMLTLVFVYRFIKDRYLGLIAVFCLSLDSFYWRYSEIPEVFTLNTLCIAIILFLSLHRERWLFRSVNLKYSDLIPLVFFLGALNHLTIIFIAPVVLIEAWNRRRDKGWYISSLVGFGLFISGYLSLLWLRTDDIYSWGNIQTVRDVLSHFLRQEYGTFSLSGIPHNWEDVKKVYTFFGEHIFKNMAIFVLAIAGIFYWKGRGSLRWNRLISSIVLSLGLYLILFIGRSNVPVESYGIDTLGRFTIMFSVLFVFLLSGLHSNQIIKGSKEKVIILSAIMIFFLFKVSFEGSKYDYSENTILEDYGVNLLNIAEKEKVSLIFLAADSELYSLRYTQKVLKHPSQAVVSNMYTIRYSWFVEKIKRQLPDIVLRDEYLEIEKAIFLPNIEKMNFLITRDFANSKDVQITYMPLGRLITKGHGVLISSPDRYIPQFRSGSEVVKTPLPEFDPDRAIFAQYSFYFLAGGLEAYSLGNWQKALESFEKALSIVPYCTPALENICKIKGARAIADFRCQGEASFQSYPYFKLNER